MALSVADDGLVENPIARDDLVEVDLRRTGLVDWSNFGGGDGLIDLALLSVAWSVNLVVHLVVFWGGWTLWVREAGDEGELIRKVRYRRKRQALADAERQLAEGRAALGVE
ncbi:hypothetical protein ACFVWG_26330 [Kribbella sp. NPDC058245]|uniref:hypothetical protein n=1 Tax=Kribbella sp. NPDC058245 TaxID=3346399 RepID=UPI0036EA2794